MPDPADASLQLKKRARRRLVGAIAFAGLAAVVLPMVMDEEPKQQVQDVQIRIPGQDQSPFNPKVAKGGPSTPAASEKAAPEKTEPAAEAQSPVKPAEPAPAKVAEKKSENVAPPAAEKVPAAPAASAGNNSHAAEAKRAADILAGKSETAAGGSAQYIILIGAFENPANVRNLQTKIGELGVKVFTEPLVTPDGKKKTRVRAGPFPSSEAAEKALERIKRIGVDGVVAKQ